MSYKSYAQTGQFGTYKIDLPIKTEINEDLRAASDFAKQMERSQKYREKWAHSYLTKLQAKSSIERQNRDDNFEFLQKNFKAIYEGEQRQFEGEIAKLRREQAEAAGADPGFLEKVLPGLLKLVPSAINIIGNINAAKLQDTNKWSQDITDQFQQAGVTFTVPELESMRNIAAKSPELAEQMFKARAEGTGVGWQDLQRYTTLNGEALAFRNMNTGLTHLGKVEHLIKQQLLPGGSLDAASYAGNDTEWYDALNKTLTDAKQYIYGDYPLNDTTRAQINKWEGGIKNDANRKYFNIKEGQAKVQYEQQQQHKVNFIVSGEPSEVGDGLFKMQRTLKSYYEGRGFTPKEAHEAAFTDMMNLLTGENSLATVEDFDLFTTTFHKRRNEHIKQKGGAPIEKGKGWAYETAAVARRKMLDKSSKLTTHGTKQRLKGEEQILNNFFTKVNTFQPGSAEQQNFISEFQREVKESGVVYSDGFYRKVLSLAHNSVVPQRPSFEQQTGMTHASLIKTTERLVLSKLKGAGSAYNNGQSDAYLKGLQSTQSAVFEIVGNTKVNFNKYAGEFPNITNPEALRHEILTRSYQDLVDKGEIGLENVNADGTAKVPAEAVTFRRIGGENPTGMTVQGFEDKAKQEGDKFFKTFTPLTPNDRGVYDRYAEIRGSMPEGADPDHHDMQLMANTPRMRSLKKVHKDKSIYELMDLDLKALDYEGLRNIPLTKVDINKNRGIARRILMGSAPVQTKESINTARLITNHTQNRGELVDTGLKTYDGSPLMLSNAGADQAMKQAFADAAKAGVDLSAVVNNTYRSHAVNAATPGSSPNSNHLWGGAVDINWNAPGAYWWKQNAKTYGFHYNPYSSKSTHYDFHLDQWEASPWYSQPQQTQKPTKSRDQMLAELYAIQREKPSPENLELIKALMEAGN